MESLRDAIMSMMSGLWRRRGNAGEQKISFTVHLIEDKMDGGFVAEVLELPGCVSQGETYEETMANISDAIAEVFATRLAPQIEAPRQDDGSDIRHVSLALAAC